MRPCGDIFVSPIYKESVIFKYKRTRFKLKYKINSYNQCKIAQMNYMLDYSSVLIRPRVTSLASRSQVNLQRTFSKFPYATKKWTGIPIMVANMDTTGTFEVHREVSKHRLLTMLHKHYTVDQLKGYIHSASEAELECVGISSGITDRDFKKLTDIKAFGFSPNFINIDVANGYMDRLTDYTCQIREMFPESIIIAGNVVCGERTRDLIVNGKVDIVKVGIGPGAACLTRQKAGVGIPQLSAVMDCAKAAHEVGGYIIADGGITCPGDMSKAFCGGADFIMCGSVFAGHYENPGEIIEENGNKYKMFYGMSSAHAMKKYAGKKAEYRSSEGRVVKMKLKGHIQDTIEDYLGGVRSTCTYIDAKDITEMPAKGNFVMVQNQLNLSLV